MYPELEVLNVWSSKMDFGGGVDIHLPMLKLLHMDDFAVQTTGDSVHVRAYDVSPAGYHFAVDMRVLIGQQGDGEIFFNSDYWTGRSIDDCRAQMTRVLQSLHANVETPEDLEKFLEVHYPEHRGHEVELQA
ncbi:hypothetical protein E2562_026813 [Oryza meyeriana var. granulata]|uniref:Uncharacterized protein n=1 Tax=Oryza meyeriana var. granulata TaxID=110450 RepID=A0A6G1CJ70_9ORYZ|nr:hypothetical protein E2562_026813 [Oryza meyeriana var. granulata]